MKSEFVLKTLLDLIFVGDLSLFHSLHRWSNERIFKPFRPEYLMFFISRFQILKQIRFLDFGCSTLSGLWLRGGRTFIVKINYRKRQHCLLWWSGRELDGDAQLVKLQRRETSDQGSKPLKVRLSVYCLCVCLFFVCVCLFWQQQSKNHHHHHHHDHVYQKYD